MVVAVVVVAAMQSNWPGPNGSVMVGPLESVRASERASQYIDCISVCPQRRNHN